MSERILIPVVNSLSDLIRDQVFRGEISAEVGQLLTESGIDWKELDDASRAMSGLKATDPLPERDMSLDEFIRSTKAHRNTVQRMINTYGIIFYEDNGGTKIKSDLINVYRFHRPKLHFEPSSNQYAIYRLPMTETEKGIFKYRRSNSHSGATYSGKMRVLPLTSFITPSR